VEAVERRTLEGVFEAEVWSHEQRRYYIYSFFVITHKSCVNIFDYRKFMWWSIASRHDIIEKRTATICLDFGIQMIRDFWL
jgi:hypothetical protein